MAVAAPTRPPTEGAAFALRDWLLLASVALTWGSSFVLIEEALENFEPALISLLRIVLGALTVMWFRAARRPVERGDWGAIGLVGVLWMTVPFLLFPIAQQWISSSLAGMINGGVPLVAALVATVAFRKPPGPYQSIGLVLGFAGVVAVTWPAVQGAKATALGALLVILATVCYGISLNVIAPLQRKYGALAVLFRVQIVAILLTLVPGVIAGTQSNFAWPSLIALVPLGALGTGLAFAAMSTLVGRVGASRGSITIYFVPVVAIVLGVILRDEKVALISLVGTALILMGAYLTSRAERPASGLTSANDQITT